jgi:GNAT superfamily N-acetyltransferase
MDIIIRKANIKDIDILVKMWKEFMKLHDEAMIAKNPKIKPYVKLRKDAPELFRKFSSQQIKSEKGLVLIAEVNGKPAGYVLSLIKSNIPVYELSELGYISDMYVKKEYQGLGLSSKLKDETVKWFKEKKIKHMSLRVYYDNDHARQVYEKWGFFNHSIEMCREI